MLDKAEATKAIEEGGDIVLFKLKLRNLCCSVGVSFSSNIC